MRCSILSLLAALALATSARPAAACRGCTPPTLRQIATRAPEVFSGRVTAVGDRAVTVQVDRVWKGRVSGSVEVETSCGRVRKVGARAIFFGVRGWPSKWIDHCMRVRKDTEGQRARVTAALPPP